jgi:ribonuclease-3
MWGEPVTLEEFAVHNKLRFKAMTLLQEALTHSSYLNEHPDAGNDNERLEFLGDSVVAYIATLLLFERFPEMREGEMTRLRAALVRADSLAALASECDMGELLRMARGEEAGGGRTRTTMLGDAFEALIGALYVDQGLAAVRKWLLPRLEKRLDEIQRHSLDKDARSLLQEVIQERLGITPSYEVIASEGPEHSKAFTIAVKFGDRVIATGSGRSKQAAAQAAAQAAIETIEAQ